MTNQDLFDYNRANGITAPSGDVIYIAHEEEKDGVFVCICDRFEDKGGNVFTPDEALNRYGLTHDQVEAFIASRPASTHTFVGTGVLSDAAAAEPTASKISRFFSRK